MSGFFGVLRLGNFGCLTEVLDAIVDWACPLPRPAQLSGTRRSNETRYLGLVVQIQANMDPSRCRIAFMSYLLGGHI